MNDQEREDTFERWISEYRPLLHRTVRAFARPADADDLMQELLLSLWKALPAYRSESRASTFVYRVTHNAALTWHRGHRRRMIETLPEPEAVPESLEGSCLHRDERMLNLLYERIHELSPVDRSLMLLSLDDLGYQEIGAIHGLSSNVVGVRLHRLRKQILSDMKENFDDL